MKEGWELRLSNPKTETRKRILLVLLVLAIPLAAFIGWQMAGSESKGKALRIAQKRLAEQAREIEIQAQRMAVLESSDNVTQLANEQNRQTIKLLEEQVFNLQQELAQYKGALAPEAREEGVRIRAFEVLPSDEPNLFRYRLLLSRVGKRDKPVTGEVKVTIEGKLDGKTVKLPLMKLSEDLPSEAISFNFKHFQSFPDAGRLAELRLPVGFEPQQIRVRAEAKGEKPMERLFKWSEE